MTTPTATDRTAQTLATVERFNAALNRRDLDAAMAETTDDVRFENTSPSPEGEPFIGTAAVRAFFQAMLEANRGSRFDEEDVVAAGDRCTVRWVYHWVDPKGKPGHVRGVDILKLRDGRGCEKFA